VLGAEPARGARGGSVTLGFGQITNLDSAKKGSVFSLRSIEVLRRQIHPSFANAGTGLVGKLL
jgi:hypothetical protein